MKKTPVQIQDQIDSLPTKDKISLLNKVFNIEQLHYIDLDDATITYYDNEYRDFFEELLTDFIEDIDELDSCLMNYNIENLIYIIKTYENE
jgi:hypothetical protein